MIVDMAEVFAPQSQAGVMSFYDAKTNGPKINPKLMLALVVLFTAIVLILDHIAFSA
jgi:preprotein translocase subunit Sec61beta